MAPLIRVLDHPNLFQPSCRQLPRLCHGALGVLRQTPSACMKLSYRLRQRTPSIQLFGLSAHCRWLLAPLLCWQCSQGEGCSCEMMLLVGFLYAQKFQSMLYEQWDRGWRFPLLSSCTTTENRVRDINTDNLSLVSSLLVNTRMWFQWERGLKTINKTLICSYYFITSVIMRVIGHTCVSTLASEHASHSL